MKLKTTLVALTALASIFTTQLVTANEPVWDGNTVVLQSEKLAEGVFAYYPEGATKMQEQGKPIATSGG